MAVQDSVNRLGPIPVWTGCDDGHTCGEGVPRTATVALTKGGGVERGSRERTKRMPSKFTSTTFTNSLLLLPPVISVPPISSAITVTTVISATLVSPVTPVTTVTSSLTQSYVLPYDLA